jgi:vacuolar-type H+-ATPase subunit I/STV1
MKVETILRIFLFFFFGYLFQLEMDSLAIQAPKSLNMANHSHSKFETVSQLLANFVSYKKVFIAGCNTVVVQRLLWQHGA